MNSNENEARPPFVTRGRLLWAARAVAAFFGAGLLYQAALFLLGAAGVLSIDSSPVVWLALGLLCALPGTALLWFATGKRFAVWDVVAGPTRP